jgi:hypothetical protein
VASLLAASDETGCAREATARDIGLVACDGAERGAAKRNAKMRTNEIATSQQRAPEDLPKEYPPLGFSRFVCVNFHPNAHGHATPSMPIMTPSRLNPPPPPLKQPTTKGGTKTTGGAGPEPGGFLLLVENDFPAESPQTSAACTQLRLLWLALSRVARASTCHMPHHRARPQQPNAQPESTEGKSRRSAKCVWSSSSKGAKDFAATGGL